MQDSRPRLIHYVTLHPESVLPGRAGQVNEAVGQLVIDRRLVRYGGDFGVGQRRLLSSCAALVQGIGPGVQVFVAGCHAVNVALGGRQRERRRPGHIVDKRRRASHRIVPYPRQGDVVGGSGLEPLTSCVSSKYSNQLS